MGCFAESTEDHFWSRCHDCAAKPAAKRFYAKSATDIKAERLAAAGGDTSTITVPEEAVVTKPAAKQVHAKSATGANAEAVAQDAAGDDATRRLDQILPSRRSRTRVARSFSRRPKRQSRWLYPDSLDTRLPAPKYYLSNADAANSV